MKLMGTRSILGILIRLTISFRSKLSFMSPYAAQYLIINPTYHAVNSGIHIVRRVKLPVGWNRCSGYY